MITGVLDKKQGVRMVGFGTSKVNHREDRKGRNTQTGKSMTISTRNVPAFKTDKGLKK